MDDVNRGGRPAAVNETAAWSKFEHALTTYVAGMTDPADHLDLEVPGTLCACFAAAEPGQVQLVMPKNDTPSVRPVEDSVELARLAMGAIRDEMHLAHPQLLTVNASGPQAALRGMLGLEDSHDVPQEPGSPAAPVVVSPSDREELNGAISEVLNKKYGDEPTRDSDDDFVLTHLDQPVWVHAFDDRPAVRIMARVVHDVHSRRQTAVETAVLNRDSVYVTWTMRGREVWQQITFSANPFAPTHLDEMLDLFLTVMSETRDDLALRCGGRVA